MTEREISFPFRLDGQGRVATVSDPSEAARQHLTTYLLTQPGERVMRPDFGTPIRDYIFENLDPLQVQLLASRSADKVARDVPHVTLHNVTATTDSAQSTVRLAVQFTQAVGGSQGTVDTTAITMGRNG